MADNKRAVGSGAPKIDRRESAAPAQLDEMKKFAKQLRSNPSEARDFFEGAGILGKDGKLAPAYVEA